MTVLTRLFDRLKTIQLSDTVVGLSYILIRPRADPKGADGGIIVLSNNQPSFFLNKTSMKQHIYTLV